MHDAWALLVGVQALRLALLHCCTVALWQVVYTVAMSGAQLVLCAESGMELDTVHGSSQSK
jgi:hypothetical protein